MTKPAAEPQRLSRKELRRLARQGALNTDEQAGPAHSSHNNVTSFPASYGSKKQDVRAPRELTPKNDEQRKYLNTLKNFSVVVGIGPAGTGKTFLPSAYYIQQLLEGKIGKIILIRPNVPLGPSLGSLPGSLYEKMKPWIAPYFDGFSYYVNPNKLKELVETEAIEVLAVEHMRGRTLGGHIPTVVLADEAQNLSREALKCLTQRLGSSGKLVLTGDQKQCDLPGDSPLVELLEKLETYERKPVAVIELLKSVRSETAEFFVEFWD